MKRKIFDICFLLNSLLIITMIFQAIWSFVSVGTLIRFLENQEYLVNSISLILIVPTIILWLRNLSKEYFLFGINQRIVFLVFFAPFYSPIYYWRNRK